MLANATLDEVRHLRLGFLPCFPYTHADAATKPLVGFFKESLHVRKVVVPYPTVYILGKLLLPLVISPAIASTGQFFPVFRASQA